MDYDVGADLLLYSTSYYIQQNCNVCIYQGNREGKREEIARETYKVIERKLSRRGQKNEYYKQANINIK